MNSKSCRQPALGAFARRLAAVLVMVIGPTCFVVQVSAKERAQNASQEAFGSADLAIEALIASVRSGGTEDILKVLGPQAKRIVSSGDPIADQAAREKFLAVLDEGHKTAQEGDNRIVLIIGKDEFPFPIPVVKNGNGWRFDAKAGEEEILNRRIGENELKTMEAVRAYVDAQREYALEDRDGKGVQYAQKFLSSEGIKDGLYWPSSEGETESPLGPLIANAKAEGYAAKAGTPSPYHGYNFKILNAQGKSAAGGAMSYVVRGRMIGGFGLLAMPAEYGNSGVTSFMVNHEGVIFEQDLGPNTSRRAARIKSFDPDEGWKKVEPQ